MRWSWIILLLFVGAIALLIEIFRRKRFRPFSSRSCSGRYWRQRFRDTSNDEIRAFLLVFVDGFALRRKHSLKFRPDDRIMDVYRAINPPELMGVDAMELEHFGLDLHEQYGLSLDDIWRDDITLGEVFEKVKVASTGGSNDQIVRT